MAKRSGMIVGGLLAGLGRGLEMQAAQMREDALLKLREKMVIDAENRAEERTIAGEQRRGEDLPGRVGLLGLAQEYKRLEGETEQQYKERLLTIQHGNELEEIGARGEQDRVTQGVKFENDKQLERLRSSLDISEDAASQRLAQEIDANEVKSIEAADDGSMLVVYNDGRTVRMRNVKLRDNGGEGEETGGLIAGAQARRNGVAAASPPPAAAATSTKPTAQQLQNSVDAMLHSGSIPRGQATGQKLTSPDGTELTWNGARWIVDPEGT